MNGNFSLPAAAYASFHANNNTTYMGGTTTFAPTGGYDTIYLNGTGTALTIAPTGTWTGAVTVQTQAANLTFANQGTMNFTAGANYIDGNNTGFTFQNTGAVTVASGASLYLGNYSNDAVSNASGATLTANGGTIVLGTSLSTWANLGTLNATNNGIIDFLGTYATAALGGTIESSAGGVLNLEGALNNVGSTLNPPVTGAYTLDGATVTGGTVASGALTFSSNGGTLSGVTMSGNFSLPASSYATFNSNGGTTFTGGTTAFATVSYDAVYLGSGTGAALTLSPSTTWSGDFDIYGTAAGLSIINQGTMSLPGSGGYAIESQSSLDGLSISNSGLIVTNGASLYLGSYANDSFTNQPGGTVEANGGVIYVDYNLATSPNLATNTLTGGTWEATGGGTLAFYGTANAIGTNAATIILSGPGSTIETRSGAGPSYQTIEQTLATNNGTLEVLANRNFASTSAGITNNGTIQLGGGALTAASLTNGSGGTLSGYGTFGPTGGVTIGNGVLVSPGPSNSGNYVATLSFSTPLTFGQGGATTFDIENASGAAGTGYDTINATGTLTVSATPGAPFTINIESINPGTGLPGLATFNMAQSYQWTLASAGSVSGFNASDFNFNTGSFANSLGTGYFSVSSSATDIFLNFTPVPEPSTWALIACGGVVLGLASLRLSSRARR